MYAPKTCRRATGHMARKSLALLQNKGTFIATRAAIYMSLRALRTRNRIKVSKKVFSGVCRKVPKKYPKSLKIPKKIRKSVGIWGLFRAFLGLFCIPPKRPFLRLFCRFGPGGPRDSCTWRLGLRDFHTFLLHVLQTPTVMAYEPRLLCHMNRFYWGWEWS